MKTNLVYASTLPTMIGLVVVFGVLTTCSANSYVEKEISQIRATLDRQEREIKELRSENKILRADVDKLNAEVESLRHGVDTSPGHPDEIRGNIDGEEETIQNQKFNMISESDEKRIRHTRTSPEPVAFYAYLSKDEPNPSINHSLKFDVVKTNLGGGYSEYSGIFTAPSSGVYVFTWTIYTAVRGQTRFNIYVNHDVVDGTYGETEDVNDFDSDSGTIVVSLNARDNVYIRSAIACTAYVISNPVTGRTSFAGWRLN